MGTWVLDSSGTTAALTLTSETDLATSTSNATFVAQVDTTNMVDGDLLEMRVYTKCLTGDSLIATWKATYQHAQIINNKVTPMVASDISMKVTLNQQAGGAGRTYKWKILRQ